MIEKDVRAGILGDQPGALSPPAAQPLQTAGHRDPVSRATITVCNATGETPVSIHAPPRGERRVRKSIISCARKFQSTLLRGERRSTVQNLALGEGFQSTLPRGERRTTRTRGGRNQTVSIHAPARGATCFLSSLRAGTNVSIHAPARGATILRTWGGLISTGFNPRSREGSDNNRTQGTTVTTCFNPRSREGSDVRTAHR